MMNSSISNEIHVNQCLKPILDLIINEEKINDILKLLPSFPKLISYKTVWQLGPGKHSPCIHESIPQLTMCTPIANTNTGKTAKFRCHNNDAQKLKMKINSQLGKFGYQARVNGDYIYVRTSKFTSVSQILAKLGLVPLFCQHDKNNEVIFFAEPFNLKNYNLLKAFHEAEEIFYKKFGTKLLLPKNGKKIKCRNVQLPDFKTYNPEFMEFIIKYRPKTQQLKTYIALYNLTVIGIPIVHINKRDLIDLVQKYTKMPKSTVEKHLQEREIPLQEKITIDLFSTSESEINNYFKRIKELLSYDIFSIVKDHSSSLEEVIKNGEATSKPGRKNNAKQSGS